MLLEEFDDEMDSVINPDMVTDKIENFPEEKKVIEQYSGFPEGKRLSYEIMLGERTEETVRIYFEKAKQPVIKAMLPQKAQTVEEALEDYKETLLPSATSFGRTIVVDGKYVGDVWCYCIDKGDTPNAMLSYCVFEKDLWNAGVATKGIALFLDLIHEKIALETIGAFTYADNIASKKVLEKNGFALEESFVEDGRESCYYQKAL